jgi:hypothetical protein
VLFNKDDATRGKFAFTTEEYDMFEICFESKIPHGKPLLWFKLYFFSSAFICMCFAVECVCVWLVVDADSYLYNLYSYTKST